MFDITKLKTAEVLTEEKALKEKQQLELEFKTAKEQALNSIIVTTNLDNSFDGNERARTNMLSAIMMVEVLNKTETNWKLADNTKILVTMMELKEALALSIQEVGRIVNCTTIDELQ